MTGAEGPRPSAPGPLRASSAEREQLAADFVRLCEIESPSRRERAVAEAVAAELHSCGLRVEEDESAAATGSDSGNLLARIPGPPGAPTVLLCAHLDTVPLTAPVEVLRESGRFSNRNDGILGADNKTAVAVLLAIARRYGPAGPSVPVELSALPGPPVGLELLFTTCEEIALLGAKELTHELRADFGFVFDHATPLGELIVAAPTYYRVDAEIHGAAAHAGIRPEAGHNAIAVAAEAIASLSLGRLDDETTANVGTIHGGTAANVVAERCTVTLEARSLDDAKAGQAVGDIVDAFAEAAADMECDVETTVERLFRAYRLPAGSPPVRAASAALEALGIEPRPIATGGGSDANVFVADGLPVLNVANGTEGNHQPDESVTVAALETALDLTLGILGQSGSLA
ncbi:MAG TPA: M20/M25/M40 family metallo-hydrolase [Thermoleophilaceae bacterium]|nr:M20/M25/M40 family metallo-hydrolase [Thermoleophilaceae bacterium]